MDYPSEAAKAAACEGVDVSDIEIISVTKEKNENEVITRTLYKVTRRACDAAVGEFLRRNAVSDPFATKVFWATLQKELEQQSADATITIMQKLHASCVRAFGALEAQKIPLIEAERGTKFVELVLLFSGISAECYWLGGGGNRVYVTDTGQLIASYSTFVKHFCREKADYKGWQAHHVIEDEDWKLLGSEILPYEDSLCVLVPKDGHLRINSLLRRSSGESAPTISPAYRYSKQDLIERYRNGYVNSSPLGDYTGGGETRIHDELMVLVKTLLSCLPGFASLPEGKREVSSPTALHRENTSSTTQNVRYVLGMRVKGVVRKAGSYGVDVELPGGVQAYLPYSSFAPRQGYRLRKSGPSGLLGERIQGRLVEHSTKGAWIMSCRRSRNNE